MLTLPQSYKAIALFTPGGDLVYSLDPDRRQHWHLDLCVAIQEVWHLSEPPHFLVPIYTATIDYQWDPRTQIRHIYAEAYRPSFPHRHLLNLLFQLPSPAWRCLDNPQGQEDLSFLLPYRRQFPQLWERQDWILDLTQVEHVRHSLSQWPPTLVQPLPAVGRGGAPSAAARRGGRMGADGESARIDRVRRAMDSTETIGGPSGSLGNHPGSGVDSGSGFDLGSSSGSDEDPDPGFNPNPDFSPGSDFNLRPGESATVLDRAHGGPSGGEMEERDLVTEIDRSYVLRLFVAGHGSSTLTILQHLYSLLEAHVTVPYTLRVVDIVKYPDQAEINQVKAVPTLIRVWPEPTYRVVGYFERWDQLAQLFD